MIKKYANGRLRVMCEECKLDFEEDVSNKDIFLEHEVYGYLPHGMDCPNCKSRKFLNPFIPEGEYDEFEMEALGVIPERDLNERKYLRDLIWDKRKDLQGKSRALRNANGQEIVNAVLNRYKGHDKLKNGPYAGL